MSKEEVVKAHTSVGGILWKEYDAKLAKTSIGPQMKAIEQERDSAMRAFERTWVEFDGNPTGYDATGLKPEYSYRNKEALLQLTRGGKTRYFFFIQGRLWKIYDAVPLGDSGAYGKTFADAVNTMNGKLGVQGRIVPPDAAAGRAHTLVDWRDQNSHMRLVDRSGEGVCGLVLEDLSTVNNLASLRSVKEGNPLEIDPTIAAVTKGDNRTDPNGASAAYFSLNVTFQIPAQSVQFSVSRSCAAPANSRFWAFTTRTHKLGVLARVRRGTQDLVASNDWIAPRTTRLAAPNAWSSRRARCTRTNASTAIPTPSRCPSARARTRTSSASAWACTTRRRGR